MTDRRQVTRKEPIPVEVAALDDAVLVRPLPWRSRNDLGKLIVSVYEDAVRQFRAAGDAAKDDNTAHIPFWDGLIDYDKVLVAAGISVEAIDAAEWEELMTLCGALCEVNNLQNCLYMLDPNAPSPIVQRTTGDQPASDGAKTSFGEDSSSPEFDQTTSSN